MAITIIKHPAKLILSKQPVAFTVESDATDTPLRIKANISGDTNADSIAADASGQAEFELSDYLQGLITERYKMDATPALYTNVPWLTKFTFTEMTGSPPIVGDDLDSSDFYLLDGYIPKSKRKALYGAYPSLLEYLKYSQSLLTWWPNAEPVKISQTQKQFINYIQISFDTLDIILGLKLHFTDGSVEPQVNPFRVNGVPKYSIVYFPVDYVSLDIAAKTAAYPGKTLSHYEVIVKYFAINKYINNTLPYYFQPDPDFHPNLRLLYIRNAFGFLEILRCTGQGEQTNSLKFEMVRTDGRFLPEKINWKCEKADKVKVNTGFMTAAQIQWLSDLDFIEAYELIGDNLQPILFTDMDIPVIHDDVYQYSATLEYEYSYEESKEVE